MTPIVDIPEKRHWKVGDGIDINGGDYIGQIALVFLDDTHFEVRLFNEDGERLMTTPGILDVGVIKNRHGKIPKQSQFKVLSKPLSLKQTVGS